MNLPDLNHDWRQNADTTTVWWECARKGCTALSFDGSTLTGEVCLVRVAEWGNQREAAGMRKAADMIRNGTTNVRDSSLRSMLCGIASAVDVASGSAVEPE